MQFITNPDAQATKRMAEHGALLPLSAQVSTPDAMAIVDRLASDVVVKTKDVASCKAYNVLCSALLYLCGRTNMTEPGTYAGYFFNEPDTVEMECTR